MSDEEYKGQLYQPENVYVPNRGIGSKLHQIYETEEGSHHDVNALNSTALFTR